MVLRASKHPGYVLGYHGCDRRIGEQVIAGRQELAASKNAYDWLGHGIYFWEDDYVRAAEWANERMKLAETGIRAPYVVGAVIDLGHCLSLLRREDIKMTERGFQLLSKLQEQKGEPLPENSRGDDKFKRELDCGVIQAVHTIRKMENQPEYDSVRGMFQEGKEAYPGAGFRTKNHIQICIRNSDCIKGYFKVRG